MGTEVSQDELNTEFLLHHSPTLLSCIKPTWKFILQLPQALMNFVPTWKCSVELQGVSGRGSSWPGEGFIFISQLTRLIAMGVAFTAGCGTWGKEGEYLNICSVFIFFNSPSSFRKFLVFLTGKELGILGEIFHSDPQLIRNLAWKRSSSPMINLLRLRCWEQGVYSLLKKLILIINNA